MATIGTFKKTGSNEFTGEIVTLSVQAKNVRIVPDQRATGENAPSHRVLVGRAEIGAAWSKQSPHVPQCGHEVCRCVQDVGRNHRIECMRLEALRRRIRFNIQRPHLE